MTKLAWMYINHLVSSKEYKRDMADLGSSLAQAQLQDHHNIVRFLSASESKGRGIVRERQVDDRAGPVPERGYGG